MEASYIENCLCLGIIPECLNFCLSNEVTKDPQLMYNDWYLTPEYIVSKFPKMYVETSFLLPIVSQTIQDVQKQKLTPLEQLEIKSKNIYNGKHPDLH